MKMQRVVQLDVLRFIAAFSVLLFHYVAWFSVDYPKNSLTLDLASKVTQFGALGVHLFFLISGFVIMASATNRTPFGFLVARGIRLYPTYWICLSITSIFLIFSQSQFGSVSLKEFLVNLTMFQSYTSFKNIDGVYWTLAKELQFYLVVFGLLLTGLLKYTRLYLSVWLLCGFTYYFFKQPFFMGWFISPEYSSLFIAGICLYHLMAGDKNKRYFQLMLGLSFVLTAFNAWKTMPEFLHRSSSINLAIAIAILFAIHLVFILIIYQKWTLAKSQLLLTIGGLTYSLYLIHNICGKIILNYSVNILGPLGACIFTAIIALAAAAAIHLYLEKPLARALKHIAKN